MRGGRMLAIVAAILVLGLAAFFGYGRLHKRNAYVAQVSKPAVRAAEEITLAGTVQPVQVVNVPAPVDGTIDQFMSDTGEHVSSGQVLARIKNVRLAVAVQTAQLDVEQARNQLSRLESALIAARLEVSRSEADAIRVQSQVSQAEKTFERQQVMFREGVTPRLTFEKAQHEYNALRTESQNLAETVKKAAEQVESTAKEIEPARKAVAQRTSDFEDAEAAAAAGEVNSPADGLVIARRGKPGEPVTPAMSDLFQIAVDPLVLQVVAPIDSRAAARIQPGQPVTMEIGATGNVREVKPGQVFIDLAKPLPEIKLGMTVRIKLKLK
jgi:multidrug resistance efflux pump